jgi:hypothetical protein
MGCMMNEEHTTAAVRRYLDEPAGILPLSRSSAICSEMASAKWGGGLS